MEKKPELVNCVARQPPRKDDGQSPLQVAFKTGRFEIAHLLLDSGADVNFIEGPDSCDDWRMPVLSHAVLTAGMSCRHTVCTDLGDRVLKEEVSSQEKADAAYALLKEYGADFSEEKRHIEGEKEHPLLFFWIGCKIHSRMRRTASRLRAKCTSFCFSGKEKPESIMRTSRRCTSS